MGNARCLGKHFLEVDGQFGKNMRGKLVVFDGGCEPVELPLGIEYELDNHFFCRIDDPIFADAGLFIHAEFFAHFHTAVARRQDFNYPVGGAVAALLVEFTLVAKDAKVGLDYGGVASFFVGYGKADVKGSNENLAGALSKKT